MHRGSARPSPGRRRRPFIGRLSKPTRDAGSAVAEFALISVLLVVLLFAVLQVGLYFYTRSVVASAAADGARYGANSGVDATAGAARATALISNGLSPAMARQVPCTGDLDTAGGVTAARVHCRGEVRSVFFPAGRWIELDLTEESLQERS